MKTTKTFRCDDAWAAKVQAVADADHRGNFTLALVALADDGLAARDAADARHESPLRSGLGSVVPLPVPASPRVAAPPKPPTEPRRESVAEAVQKAKRRWT